MTRSVAMQKYAEHMWKMKENAIQNAPHLLHLRILSSPMSLLNPPILN